MPTTSFSASGKKTGCSKTSLEEDILGSISPWRWMPSGGCWHSLVMPTENGFIKILQKTTHTLFRVVGTEDRVWHIPKGNKPRKLHCDIYIQSQKVHTVPSITDRDYLGKKQLRYMLGSIHDSHQVNNGRFPRPLKFAPSYEEEAKSHSRGVGGKVLPRLIKEWV